MAKTHLKYVLIGGGVASSSAAEAIRRVDRDGEILLVAQENVRPYERHALSNALLSRKVTRESLFTRPVRWFTENNVQLRTAQRVARLDLSRRSVLLSNGEEIGFDQLLMATGATPRRLGLVGADLPGVLALRTLEDVVNLQHTVDHALASGRRHLLGIGRGRVTVVGANVLGVDVSTTLNRLGLEVDLVVGKPHVWSRLAGEVTGRYLSRLLEARGIVLHAGTYVTRIEGDGRAQRVVLDDGSTLDTDVVVVCAGVVPNRDLVRGTTIRAEKAIVVDERCRTNEPGIYAAGDCAAVFDPLFNKHRWTDLYDTASMTGAIAGANMAGVNSAFNAVSELRADIADQPVRVFGEARFVHHRIVRGHTGDDSTGFSEIGIAVDGRVAQVLTVGTVPDAEADLIDLVKTRRAVNGNQERIKDASIPLHLACAKD